MIWCWSATKRAGLVCPAAGNRAVPECADPGRDPQGVEALTDSCRRTVLREWLERELPVFFADRLPPIDAGVAALPVKVLNPTYAI